MIATREIATLLIFFFVLIVVNLVTSTLYPIIWMDEVMLTDPAVNLLRDHSFTTTAWPFMDQNAFFAGYPPLYSAVLAAWMTLTGFSPVGVRSLNYFLIVLTGATIWWAVVRGGWLANGWQRILLVALVLLGYGMSFSYRGGRPDTLMALLVAGSYFAFTIRSATLRYVALFIISSLLPMAGVQLLPYAAIMLILLWVFLGRTYRKELLSMLLGVGAGSAMLLGIYLAKGVLGVFLLSTRGHASTGLVGALLGRGEFHHQNTLPKDLSLFVLLVAGLWMWIAQWRQGNFRWHSPLGFGLISALLIPLGMVAAGKFPTYYAWMAYLPLAICLVMSLPAATGRSQVRFVAIGILVAGCLVGLPLQLGFITYDRIDRRYEPVAQLVEAHVTREDWAICDYSAYYAVKDKAKMWFGPHYLERLSDAERDRISVLIVDTASAAAVQSIIGGQWKKVGEGIRPTKGTLTEDLLGIPMSFGTFNFKYRLQVYRRVLAASASHAAMG